MSLALFQELSQKYRFVPVDISFHADLETPITLFRKLVGDGLGYLLESVERGTVIGRYSFIGSDPLDFFRCPATAEAEGAAKEGTAKEGSDPLSKVKRWIADQQVAPLPTDAGLPPFYGGGVGYFGYDLTRHYERLPERAADDRQLPEASLMITRDTLIIDHLRHRCTLVHLAEAGDEQAYGRAQDHLMTTLERLRDAAPPMEQSANAIKEPLVMTSTFDQDAFCRAVEKCQDYIAAGDIFQVVLSQRFSMPLRAHPLNVYRALRSLNPSPYLFYLCLPEVTLAGSSPELLVRVAGDHVETHPIAGTRRRGKNDEEDARLAADLLADEKERAEHLMLVDLGRNDIGRVAQAGTVKVERFMEVENYSHVMHLVSQVTGKLAPEMDALDALRCVMPAGTLSGAPKIRAMEIIEELEPVRRGPYGGAVGYLGYDGTMDTCIAIRTVVMHRGRAEIQVGAGIVADSVPEAEYEETMNKARAMFEAMRQAEEVWA
ncbi:anthranilate synthase component I [Heliophilum fasciatum]|uniref:Anthranilate synthase component 1 n=1 Tax=Heliophilum fasciatum TaxID=35700 RepID=A0A4R2RJ16_9FIRM|nr:anthranilate synthase component I [Heliophilum fasciatum]TCP63812.1 anthranilate synthase component I [Heliophilum fasciatum]